MNKKMPVFIFIGAAIILFWQACGYAISFEGLTVGISADALREMSLSERAQIEKARELGRLIIQTEKILAEQEARGRGLLQRRIEQNHSAQYFTQGGVAYLPVPDGGGKMIIVGDLHGDADSLRRILVLEEYAKHDRNDPKRPFLAFVGDYGDVGSQSLDVALIVLRLKIADPERVILLAGNHDTDRPDHGCEDVDKGKFNWFFIDLENILGRSEGAKMFDRWTNLMRRSPSLLVVQNGLYIVHSVGPSVLSPGYDAKQGLLNLAFNEPYLDQMRFNLVAYDKNDPQKTDKSDRKNEPGTKPFLPRMHADLQTGYWIGWPGINASLDDTGATVIFRGHNRSGPYNATYDGKFLTIISTRGNDLTGAFSYTDGVPPRYAVVDLSKRYKRIDAHEVLRQIWGRELDLRYLELLQQQI